MQNMYMYNVSSHAQYNVSVPPLCAKWSMAKFQLEVLHPNTRSSVAQICNLRPPKKPLSLPTCLYLSRPKSQEFKHRGMKERSGDEAVEGNVQNGHNGCIRRLTIEPGRVVFHICRSGVCYIHLLPVCKPTVFQSKQ